MKKSKYTEEQIAHVLRQAQSGTQVADVCRGKGISEATLYVWKNKYAELGVSALHRFKLLEDENALEALGSQSAWTSPETVDPTFEDFTIANGGVECDGRRSGSTQLSSRRGREALPGTEWFLRRLRGGWNCRPRS